MLRQTADLIAASFALCAFALALVAGQLAQQPPARVLIVALIAMVICRLVGLAVGRAALVVIEEFLKAYEAAHPAPELETLDRRSGGEGSAGRVMTGADEGEPVEAFEVAGSSPSSLSAQAARSAA